MQKIRPYDQNTGKLLYGWLLLAVLSLVFAGIFAFLVALARTPVIENYLPLGRDYIYVALVGHVVLAVVIWFLAFEGFLWVLVSTHNAKRRVFCKYLGWGGFLCAGAGMGLVVIAAIFGLGGAELANYVPVLLTPVFYAGLALFAIGIALTVINSLVTLLQVELKPLPIVSFGMAVSGMGTLVAFICFGLSGYFQYATGKAYIDFERLFWGGGHILQFVNTIAMVTAWLYLSRLVFGEDAINRRLAKWLFTFYLMFIIPAPGIFFFLDTASQGYKDSFTFLMRWGLGPSTSVFILFILAFLYSKSGEGMKMPWMSPGFSSLILSMSIFLVGGFLALNIDGVNTIIPAHYHCVIGAVTIAFMGLFYEILPVFKRELWSRRLAEIQPWLYTLGILLFALGLFLAGSHGVARKTYGSDQNLNTAAKVIGMSIMGIGGLVAIGGGITFVLNALLSLLGKKKKETAAVPAIGTAF